MEFTLDEVEVLGPTPTEFGVDEIDVAEPLIPEPSPLDFLQNDTVDRERSPDEMYGDLLHNKPRPEPLWKRDIEQVMPDPNQQGFMDYDSTARQYAESGTIPHAGFLEQIPPQHREYFASLFQKYARELGPNKDKWKIEKLGIAARQGVDSAIPDGVGVARTIGKGLQAVGLGPESETEVDPALLSYAQTIKGIAHKEDDISVGEGWLMKSAIGAARMGPEMATGAGLSKGVVSTVGKALLNSAYWVPKIYVPEYENMVAQGVDPKTAKYAAAFSAVLQAGVESWQVGLGQVGGAVGLKQRALEASKSFLKEGVGEEALQGAISKLVEGVAVDGVPDPAAALQEAIKQAKESAGPIALLQFPGAAISLKRGAVEDLPKLREFARRNPKEAADIAAIDGTPSRKDINLLEEVGVLAPGEFRKQSDRQQLKDAIIGVQQEFDFEAAENVAPQETVYQDMPAGQQAPEPLDANLTKEQYKQKNPHSGGALSGDAGAFDQLPDDAIVNVYHATTRANADSFLSGGGKVESPRKKLPSKSDKMYVGSDPATVERYGDVVLEVKLPKSSLSKPPEASGKKSVGEAVIDASVGAVIDGDVVSVREVKNKDLYAYESIVADNKQEQFPENQQLPVQENTPQQETPPPPVEEVQPQDSGGETLPPIGEMPPNYVSAKNAMRPSDRGLIDSGFVVPSVNKVSAVESVERVRAQGMVEGVGVEAQEYVQRGLPDNGISVDQQTAYVLRQGEILNEHDKIIEELETVQDQAQLTSLAASQQRLEHEMANIEEVLNRGGTIAAQVLAMRKPIYDRWNDFRPITLVNRMKAAKGKPLEASERAEIQEMAAKIKEQDKRIKELEANRPAAEANAVIKKTRESRSRKKRKEAQAALPDAYAKAQELFDAGCLGF